MIGPPALIKEMLDVAVKHNVRSWTSSHPMKEVSQKVKDMDQGKGAWIKIKPSYREFEQGLKYDLIGWLFVMVIARYRYVMTN